MLIGVPVGLGIAVFLTELCPPVLRRPIGMAIELLAGIPSIIYGIWGVYYFKPFMQSLCPAVPHRNTGRDSGRRRPLRGTAARLRHPHGGARPRGYDPALRHRDLARRVRDGAARPERSCLWRRRDDVRGGAATSSSPTPGSASIGGVMLALGRALGETMAVTFVIGNAHEDLDLDPGAGHDDLGDDRQPVRRRRSRACSLPRCSRSGSSFSSSHLSCWPWRADAVAPRGEGGTLMANLYPGRKRRNAIWIALS